MMKNFYSAALCILALTVLKPTLGHSSPHEWADLIQNKGCRYEFEALIVDGVEIKEGGLCSALYLSDSQIPNTTRFGFYDTNGKKMDHHEWYFEWCIIGPQYTGQVVPVFNSSTFVTDDFSREAKYSGTVYASRHDDGPPTMKFDINQSVEIRHLTEGRFEGSIRQELFFGPSSELHEFSFTVKPVCQSSRTSH